jgi:hypothetical protein
MKQSSRYLRDGLQSMLARELLTHHADALPGSVPSRLE